MGGSVSKNVPEVMYHWTHRAKSFFNDTTPIVSGDGSTVALYSRGENLIHVLDSRGSTVSTIQLQQKVRLANVSAIPSVSDDGQRIVTRDANSVICFSRSGHKLWEYARTDKVVRSGMQSWIAQISGNGKVVIVRMFHECIWLDGDTGAVAAVFLHDHQMANSIPRISDDGSVVVVADGTQLLCYHNAVLAWAAPSPVKPNGFGGDRWGDPALSGDGSTVGVVGKDTVYLFDTKAGAPKGQIAGVRHRDCENSNEVSFSHDGSACAVVLGQEHGIAVFGGPGYSKLLLQYVHSGGQRPVAPLLTRDGRAVASKCGNAIMVFEVPAEIGHGPVAGARVQDDSAIPGGPTVHSRDYNHDRDTHHKRTFGCSHDGTLCVAVAKHQELWAFSLRRCAPQGGVMDN